jgi:hypothetical protein
MKETFQGGMSMAEGRFPPGVQSKRLPWGLCLSAFERPATPVPEGGIGQAWKPAQSPEKLLQINIRLSLTIGSYESLHNPLSSKRILPGGQGS